MTRSTSPSSGRILTGLLQPLALGALALLACSAPLTATSGENAAAPAPAAQQKKPNILIIWGDDIGYWNVSAYNQGMMGYKTPNIDRIAKEGRCSRTGTASRAAPPDAAASSRVNPGSAPACSRSGCRAPRKACRRATSRSRSCSRRRAT